jgi:hypothetical protein
MKITELKCLEALPCALDGGSVNGIRIDSSDFGEGDSGEWDQFSDDVTDDQNWGCANYQFTAFEESTPEVLKKYGITHEEFIKIGELLEDVLSPGVCGWCA